MNSPARISQEIQFNLLGLRQAHASLYRYMEKCAKSGEKVDVNTVADIYWLEVKNPESLFEPKYLLSRQLNDPNSPLNTLKCKDARQFFTTDPWGMSRYNSYYLLPVRNWLKAAIGSLVMRGVLQVIPKLDTELLEQ